MKLKQSIFEALALLVLACVVGLVFNARRSTGLVLTRDYFPVLTDPRGVLADPEGVASDDAPISNDAQLPQHGFNVVSLSEALEYYSHGESSIVFIDARDDAAYEKCHISSAIQFDYYRPDEYIDNVRDFAAEGLLDIFVRGIRVLDGVVKHPGDHELGIAPVRRLGQHAGDLDDMVDVGLRSLPFAPLVDVALRGELHRS